MFRNTDMLKHVVPNWQGKIQNNFDFLPLPAKSLDNG